MAGEIFIALEETSQAIKTTVEETKTEVESVGTAVNEIKEDVGDGAGTDLVTRVANLEAKIDALANSGGEKDLSFPYILSSDELLETLTTNLQSTHSDDDVAVLDDSGNAIIITPLALGCLRFKVSAKSSSGSTTNTYTQVTIGGITKTIQGTSYAEYIFDVPCEANVPIAVTMHGANMSTDRIVSVNNIKLYGTLTTINKAYVR